MFIVASDAVTLLELQEQCLWNCSVRRIARWRILHVRVSVRGSYSARVPRSSLASVLRVLVPHIMEEEGEDREDKKDDWREDGTAKSGRENRRESEQPHHERMKMGWSEMCAARPNLSQCRCDIKMSACRCEKM